MTVRLTSIHGHNQHARTGDENRFRFVSAANPAKKKKPNDSLSSVSDAESDMFLFSATFGNASSSEESLRRVTSIILGKSLMKNAFAWNLLWRYCKIIVNC